MCGCPLRYSLGFCRGGGGDGNEDDCVVVLFNTLWDFVGEEEETEMKTTVWLYSSILFGIL